MQTAEVCRHNRQLTVCAECAPEAERKHVESIVDKPRSCRQRIIIFRNPMEALVLVAENGKIVKATCPEYLGDDVLAAKLSACSVMRYKLGNEAGADGYPEEIEI